MKKIIFLVAIVVSLTTSMNAQIKMSSNGWVGVGKLGKGNPRRLLDVNGQAYISCLPAACGFYFSNIYDDGSQVPILLPQWGHSAFIGSSSAPMWNIYSYRFYSQDGAIHTYSDKKLKSNIRKIGTSINKIRKLNPIKYDINFGINENLPKERQELIKNNGKNRIGFIAQEVKEIFPEVVGFDSAAQLYTIDYAAIVPLLVEGFKEQQIIIESLQLEIQEFKKDNNSERKLKSSTTTGTSILKENTINSLYQNAPNPFSKSTTIQYSLAKNVKKAMICIYDMSGTQLKCIPIHFTGYGNITINGNELEPGMYMYSLLADEQLIDTKRMILTD